ncbi:putative transferase CAF17 homolog, mitochondrial [Mizuhopecten yessoensis]|uniref:Transferase CAF17-like n=1 Tax=Mizuhopecten yessoensis TaxID=6573 RepID=A0A210Q9W6_MIZYE|nr:putative transferase CAF17 homolog, mitochondrial [Mizuhopecten yessoensis]OWF45531.1 transferase CAF17-like [Mizuhopecten yessoensis]
MRGLLSQLRSLQGVSQRAAIQSHPCYKCKHCHQCLTSLKTVTVQSLRHFSDDVIGAKWSVHPLRSRGIIRLKGPDTVPFLQGLVTNDVAVVGGKIPSLYTLMLNVQGRVLYDLLMYHSTDVSGNSVLLLESDANVTSELIKLLKRYKIRKKVDIADVSEDHKVFAALCQGDDQKISLDKHLPGIISATQDPRVNSFGWRIIADSSPSVLKGFGIKEEKCEEDYHRQRYQSGIGEGVVDLPPGNCFPLESNAVYLNGVCFHKGCYIGQELTARTFHTGVTRKRLMPILFEVEPQNVSAGANIATETGKSAGKVRGHVGKYGLGLLRIAEASKKLSVKTETEDDLVVKSNIPDWWPKET